MAFSSSLVTSKPTCSFARGAAAGVVVVVVAVVVVVGEALESSTTVVTIVVVADIEKYVASAIVADVLYVERYK